MIGKFFSTFANCLRIPELNSRIIFTILMLVVCRVIALVPIPGLDGGALTEYLDNLAKNNEQGGGGLLNMYSMFTGGALERCAIGALGIMPYISATIIIQLLSAVLPGLSKLSREEGGRTKIIHYGRVLTIILCLGQGFALAVGFENADSLFEGIGRLVLYPEDAIWWYRIQTVLILTSGTALLMWLGEQITERGIGNGISLIITIGILASLPQAVIGLKDMFFPPAGLEETARSPIVAALLFVMFLAVVIGIIMVTQGQRKIPVNYASRSVGRKMYQGGSNFMPLRVNYAGVMPIIFAQALLMFPQPILTASGIKALRDMAPYFNYDHSFHMVATAMMIIFFSYFWVATQFNETQIADDLKRNNGYIPGVRPGKATSEFLGKVMSRITLAGSCFLVLVAIFPVILSKAMEIPFIVTSFFGGTSLLIMVGVMLDTMRQMETHLLNRHYDGFLKKGRIRGRS